MKPNTTISDHNTELLLQAAYKPDPVPADFAQRLEQKLLASAQELAKTQPPVPLPARPRPTAAYIVAALAACLLVAFGIWASKQPSPDVRPKSDVDINLPQAQFAHLPNDLRAGMMPRRRPAGPALGTLAEGQSLTTKAGQRRLVQLADGSRLFVNEKSRVEAGPARHLTVYHGQIYLEVAPLPDAPRFVVKSSGRVMTATGTHFAVQAEGKTAGLLVTQGKVKVEGIAEEITAGQRLVPGASSVTAAPRASHALEWTRDLLAAAETPMVPGAAYAGGALLALDPQGQEIKLALRKYHVDVHLEDGFARTTIDQTYFNTTWERLEGTFYFPLPPDASLSRLAMYVNDGNNQCKLMEGGMAEKKHAANVYETIRYQRRDPALLEWLDGSTFKMRVFPLEAKQEKRIILSYTQKLPTLYGSTRYRFPAGHNMPVVRDWSFQARVKAGANLSMWSPSHPEITWLPDNGDMVGKVDLQNAKPNEDVLLELQDRALPVDHDQPRFSSFLHENNTYLMVRYRPALPSLPRRERRDWIVLFEASAQRDPLLAGTQADIFKELLRNAEYDDTFTLVTANSTPRVYNDHPLPARPDKVSAALQFLHESTHLVGALDLEQGLQTALRLAKDAKNPHLVHLGSGTPAMGERDSAALAKLVPPSVRYVGVGVGKRWNRAFMKAAAERTGGLFTQINPDEVIAWRAFDLLATLNTPRLLDVQVAGNTENTPFLSETTMLAQGEGLCAVTRIEPGKNTLPGKVTVKGSLDGKPIVREFPVINVAAGAGHLPRTWAKYEIDRLLAAGAEKHRTEVVALSKAMYVMSPFTSLLVLETDADYEKYQVDRGRKDHLAMYACPAKIPLVYEPDGTAPVKKEVKKEEKPGQKPSCDEVLKSIVTVSGNALLKAAGDFYQQNRLDEADVLVRQLCKLDPENTAAYALKYMIHFKRNQESYDRTPHANEQFMLTPLQTTPGESVGIMPDYENDVGHALARSLPGMDAFDEAIVQRGNRVTRDRVIRRTVELYPGQSLQYPDLKLDWDRMRAYNVSLDQVAKALKANTMAPSGNVRIRDQMPIVSINSIVVDPNDIGNIPIDEGKGIYLRDVANTGSLMLGAGVNSDSGLVGSIALNDRRSLNLQPYNHKAKLLIEQARAWHDEMQKSGFDAKLKPLYEKGILDNKRKLEDLQLEVPNLFGIRLNNKLSAMPIEARSGAARTPGSSMSTTGHPPADLTPPIDWVQYYKNHGSQINSGATGGGSARVQFAPVFVSPQMQWAVPNSAWSGAPMASAYSSGQAYYSGSSTTIPTSSNPFASTYGNPFSLGLAANYYPNSSGGFGAPNSTPPTFGVATMYTSNSNTTTSLEYKRPVFDYDRTLFTNLLQYAPGLHNTRADLLATLEQEANLETPKLGSIDDDARKLIDRARSTDWFGLAVPADGPLPGYKITYNGVGQFACERTLASGLGEHVVCDGKTLWHLYPEIGLDAKRPFSRYHQGLLSSFNPAFLPQADELARGFDVRAIDGTTIALVPLGAAKLKEQEYVRLHLVFGSDGRLRERQIVEMPTGNALLRQVFLADGSLEWRDAKDKVLAKQTLSVAPAQAPSLDPSIRELVVMNMPIRSPAFLSDQAKKRGLDPEKDPSVVADRFVASCVVRSSELVSASIRDYIQALYAKGDRRLGFYTLLIAADFPISAMFAAPTQNGSPLAKFFQQIQRDVSTQTPETVSDLPCRALGSILHRDDFVIQNYSEQSSPASQRVDYLKFLRFRGIIGWGH